MKRFNYWFHSAPQVFRDAAGAFASYLTPKAMPDGGVALPFSEREAGRFRPPTVPLPHWRHILDTFLRHGPGWGLLDLWVFGGLFRDGVKAYCPTVEEVAALSSVEMSLPWSAYRQPFPTVAVVIPDGLWPQGVSASVGHPVAVITRYDSGAGVVAAVVPTLVGNSDGDHLSAHYTVRHDDPRTIEDYIAALPDDPSLGPSEDELINRLVRVAVNANLLLTNHGAKPVGTTDPKREAELRDAIRHGNRAARRAAERELAALPTVYGFEQHVRVYEREDSPATGNRSGTEVKAHWRRGHWANQAHGPGMALRKLIFRPAVMVNAHRFGGAPADTRVTLTTARTESAA